MPNPLTGSFDAVAQLRATIGDPILAVLHQRRGIPGARNTFPHSFATGIDDTVDGGHRLYGFIQAQLSPPRVELAQAYPLRVRVTFRVMALLEAYAPSSPVPKYIQGAFQLTCSMEQQATSDGSSQIRSNLTPDNLEVTFIPSPWMGLDAHVTGLIDAHIKSFISSRWRPIKFNLPASVDELVLKGMPDLQSAALLVNLTPKTADPEGVTQVLLSTGDDFAVAVSMEYIRTFLEPVLARARDFTAVYQMRVPVLGTAAYDVTVTRVSPLTVQGGRLVVTLGGKAVTSAWWAPDAEFAVTLKLGVDLVATTQQITLIADAPDVSPNVHGPLKPFVTGILKTRATAAIGSYLQSAMRQANQYIQSTLGKGNRIAQIMQGFGVVAQVRYQHLKLGPDGLVLGGTVAIERALADDPVVTFDLTPDGSHFTALDSWIPGGYVEEYTWTAQVREPHGTTRTLTLDEDHRFITDLQPDEVPEAPGSVGASDGSQVGASAPLTVSIPHEPTLWSLAIKGQRTSLKDGSESQVSAPLQSGDTNGVLSSWVIPAPVVGRGPPVSTVAIERALPVAIAVPGPDTELPGTADARPVDWGGLDALATGPSPAAPSAAPAVMAHIDAAALGGPSGVSTVVYVAAAGMLADIRTVADALATPGVQGTPVGLVLVLPHGSVERAGPALAELLRAHPAYTHAYVALAEDYDGVLAARAQVHEGDQNLPTTAIYHPDGRLAWQYAGHPEVARHAEAFATHLAHGARPPSRLLRMRVPTGAAAPDFAFDAAGKLTSLGGLRGRVVTLCFGKSWSEASQVQLRYLLATRPGDGVILTIGDGEERPGVEVQGSSGGPEVHFVADPDRRIAAAYGVPCWPTTVRITPEGHVGHATYGMTHIPQPHAPRP